MARADAWLEEVEDMLVEAWGYLTRLPDRERGWLASGSRSQWPDVVRDPVTDYMTDDAPRLPLGRREMAMVGKCYTDEACLVMMLDAPLRPLLAVVLGMKARPERGGFKWERVWEWMGGKACGVTSDALRGRYERALRTIAVEVSRREAMAQS